MTATQHSASLALGAYAESFLSGRRVVVFGDASTDLAELLLERGARLVHVYDTDPSRVARRSALGGAAGLSFATLPAMGLPVRDGAFDVGFIQNLAAFDEPADVINRLRRALSARGVGFIATPNRDRPPTFDATPEAVRELTYYEMYDLACAEFDEIRTLGQTPFVGYALADFSPDREETFSIDTAQVPGGAEEPEWFIAVVSHFPLNCDPFSVIQLPATSLLSQDLVEPGTGQLAVNLAGNLTEPEPYQAERTAELQAELAEATLRANAGERNRELLVAARDELSRRDTWVKELERRNTESDSRLAALSLECEQLRSAALQQSSSQDDLQRVKTDAEHEVQVANARVSDLSREISKLKAELESAARRQADALRLEAAKLEATKLEAAKLEPQLTLLRERNQELELAHKAQLEAAALEAQHYEQECAAYEQQLVERAQRVSELRRALAATETFGSQILLELGTLKERPLTEPSTRLAELQAETAQLATQLATLNAEHAADLAANRWLMSELENRLLESRPSQALEEQLQRARTELQRQAVLLEQARGAARN